MPSFVACVKAISSASVLDSEIVLCFFVFQEIKSPNNLKQYPEVDFLSVVVPP